jgi:hypothetical protein
MLPREDSDLSEVLAASIIRAMKLSLSRITAHYSSILCTPSARNFDVGGSAPPKGMCKLRTH